MPDPKPSKEAILYALAQRQGLVPHPVADQIRGDLFPLQRSYIEDPSRAKAALCGRRAGKTTLDSADLFDTALRFPGTLSIYLTLTNKNAKKLLWPELTRMNARYGLGAIPSISDLTWQLPNSSWIWLGGANNLSDIEKYRGFKPKKVILDECGSIGPHAEELIEEVIDPGLLDMDGTKSLTGTPTAMCAGAFYDATTNPEKGYSVHRWTCLQNPHLPHAARWLAEKRHKNGWREDTPRYLREWMGLWIQDTHSLVYRYNAAVSDYADMPTRHVWEYVLGVDFGYDDDSAFVVLAFSRTCPDVYLVECWQKPAMLVSDIAARLHWYMGRFRFARIVGDTGGLGKTFVEEFRQRCAIPIVAAEKAHKFDFIEHLNSDLATGRFKVQRTSPLVAEWGQLQWDDARKKEAPQYPNHYCLAVGTLVQTFNGPRPIESLLPGDMLLTRIGYRALVRVSQRPAPTVTTVFSNGAQLTGTIDHPVLTALGWRFLGFLQVSDSCFTLIPCPSSGPQNPSSGAGARGTGGPAPPGAPIGATTAPVASTFIGRYGRRIAGQFRRVFTSIISTATRTTTPSKTWLSPHTGTIWPAISPKNEGTSSPTFCEQRLSPGQPSGIAPPKGSIGTANTPAGPDRSGLTPYASSAAQPFCPRETEKFVQGHVMPVATVPAGVRVVYSLTVEEQHEYVAHGVVVANSDACLYAWREAKHFCYVPTDPPPVTQQEALERKAQELEQRAEQRIRERRERAFWE